MLKLQDRFPSPIFIPKDIMFKSLEAPVNLFDARSLWFKPVDYNTTERNRTSGERE